MTDPYLRGPVMRDPYVRPPQPGTSPSSLKNYPGNNALAEQQRPPQKPEVAKSGSRLPLILIIVLATALVLVGVLIWQQRSGPSPAQRPSSSLVPTPENGIGTDFDWGVKPPNLGRLAPLLGEFPEKISGLRRMPQPRKGLGVYIGGQHLSVLVGTTSWSGFDIRIKYANQDPEIIDDIVCTDTGQSQCYLVGQDVVLTASGGSDTSTEQVADALKEVGAYAVANPLAGINGMRFPERGKQPELVLSQAPAEFVGLPLELEYGEDLVYGEEFEIRARLTNDPTEYYDGLVRSNEPIEVLGSLFCTQLLEDRVTCSGLGTKQHLEVTFKTGHSLEEATKLANELFDELTVR